MARLTPRDIQEKEFSSGFRGYKEEAVDEFLDRVTASYEETFKENIDLKEEVDRLVEENKKYELIGERMQAALVAAQETADDVRKNATKEAENILREAEIKAHKLVQASRDQHRELQKSLAVVKQIEEEFRFKLKSTLQSYLKLLDEVGLGDKKEIQKWILPEDMTVLDERRREMEGREAPAVEAKTAEPKATETAADDIAAGSVDTKETAASAAKKEPTKAEEKASADDKASQEAKADVAKAQAAALMEEIAVQATEAEKADEAKAAALKAEAPKVGKTEPAIDIDKPPFDPENAKASAVTPEWAKLQDAVAEAVKEAEKTPKGKAEAKKADASKEESISKSKAEAKEAKPGKTNLDDIEIVEDESFWKDI